MPNQDPLKAYGSADIVWGLVSVPVKLFSPFEDNEIHFNQLHAKCGCRLKQGPMYCPACEMAVPKDEIIKGFEVEEGKYATFTDKDMLKLDSSKEILVREFVSVESIDPLLFQEHYFLAPEKRSERAFQLLLTVLDETINAAIGMYRARGKEHVVAICPYHGGEYLENFADGLILHQLAHANTIRDYRRTGYDPYGPPERRGGKLTPEEITMATALVRSMEVAAFQPEKYKDNLREAMMRLIERKVGEGEIVTAPVVENNPPIDLLAQLQHSDLLAQLQHSLNRVADEEERGSH